MAPLSTFRSRRASPRWACGARGIIVRHRFLKRARAVRAASIRYAVSRILAATASACVEGAARVGNVSCPYAAATDPLRPSAEGAQPSRFTPLTPPVARRSCPQALLAACVHPAPRPVLRRAEQLHHHTRAPSHPRWFRTEDDDTRSAFGRIGSTTSRSPQVGSRELVCSTRSHLAPFSRAAM
jgi:hypothetical protein